MTAEIAIMNRHAISLAADSAVTVSQWVGGNTETRYFKGANKVFELSNSHPVGLMIYGSGSLQSVPWEVIIKQFRKEIGTKSFNDLDGYAKELFDYIKGNLHLFPNDYQDDTFISEVQKIATLFLHLEANQKDEIKKGELESDELAKAYNDLIQNKLLLIDAEPLPAQFIQEEIDTAINGHKDNVKNKLADFFKNDNKFENIAINFELLAVLVIKRLIKQFESYMSDSGIVIAGFGDHDYFPGYIEYRCYGLLLGKFLAVEKSKEKINLDNLPGYIKPFAQSTMIETFWTGFSPDVFDNIAKEFDKRIKQFVKEVTDEKGCGDLDNIDERINQLNKEFCNNWTQNAYKEHAYPFNRVVGSLPIDEMAELAETLIMLQSLKEKVTQPTESVGGPIDVAVITKGDGFIWIKRKHYFKPDLNPRYFRKLESIQLEN